MLDTSLFFLMQNIFILTIIFWALSFLGELFFKKKNYIASPELFECGFLTTHDLNLTFNYNFFLTAVLLILYDIEFFFLLPFIFNLSYVSVFSIILFIIFVMFVVLSFVYDWEMVALN